MGETALSLSDIERAIAVSDPQLGALLVRYLDRGDPAPGRSELEPNELDDDPDFVEPDVPAGAVTLQTLTAAVGARGMAGKNPTERKLARLEAFAVAEASPFAPPRLRLGRILIDLYERNDPAGREALLHVFAFGTISWGMWQAAKTIYKRAEDRHDAAMFGVLAYRFDAIAVTKRADVAEGTYVYMRRRAWRFLRQLGAAVPDAYTTFAIEVLRHYRADHRGASWVAAHIWSHVNMRYARKSWIFDPPVGPDALAQRAYPQAWKTSPAPLLRLLETAHNGTVCDFAIRSLRADHPLALRVVDPAWLARLGRRPIPAIHGFVVQLLKDSPELHQSKLRALGLHDVVISFLRSSSQEAYTYALEYAAAHAPDLAISELLELLAAGAAPVKKFAAARLEAMTPQQLGVATLLRLVGDASTPWAYAKLAQAFSPRDVTVEMFVDAVSRGTAEYNALIKFFNEKSVTIAAGYFTALLDDSRFDAKNYALRSIVNAVMTELAKRTAREIGAAWIQKSLEDRNRTAVVARWLEAGMLAGAELDVEWLKTLVAKPRLRPIALKVLGDRRFVAPARVGLAWLLELARSSDAELAGFAQRMLLESFEPEDFGGVAKLWELAAGKATAEAVRTFAATYLKAHHPDLGPRLAEARALGIKPRLGHIAYPMATVRPLLRDERADVRRLAVAITGEEITAWGDPDVVYELAGSPHKEPRALGSELLMGVIAPGDVRRVPAAWVDGRRLFQLAENPHKASREVALTLIRRLYDQVGGAERLAWLMDSPDRDVRLFAVRLFWDRHRPKPLPEGFAPRKAVGAAIGTHRFGDFAAVRQFARVVLFGLPPGRIAMRDPVAEGAPQPERPLPASVAKKRLIESLRDVALEDVELARTLLPVLGELGESIAKGEWQASLQALTALRAHHAELKPL